MTDPLQTAEEHRLELRNLRLEDYAGMKEVMDRIYAGALGGAISRDRFQAQLRRFPEGQICIEDNGHVVAAALSLIVDYEQFGDQHTYDEITAEGYITTHEPDGDILYGTEVFVDPDYRDMRLGRRLYDA
ncbi:MAG: GNAT family N-acetyltransferase, partial [Gammaproteobacteria bacterium]